MYEIKHGGVLMAIKSAYSNHPEGAFFFISFFFTPQSSTWTPSSTCNVNSMKYGIVAIATDRFQLWESPVSEFTFVFRFLHTDPSPSSSPFSTNALKNSV